MTQNAYEFALKFLAASPWAMRLTNLEALVELVRTRASADQLLPTVEIPGPAAFKVEVPLESESAGGRRMLDDSSEDPSQSADAVQRASNVGVIPIRGTIKQHSSSSFFDFLFGGTSTDFVAAGMRAFMADASVGAIVLDIDSPGGSSYGIFELADLIMGARGSKPIVAIANSVAASAAYALGCAADAFYCTPGGLVGSVGVYFMHQDISKMADEAGVKVTFIQAGKNKTRGNQFQPLSEDDVAYFQGLVDETYRLFLSTVARGRGTSVQDVRRNYGDGDVLIPDTALAAGMIDGILTYDEVVRKATSVKPRPVQARGRRAQQIVDRQANAGADGLEDDDEPASTDEAEEAEREARLQAFRRTRFEAFRALAAADGAAISGG